MGSDGIGCTGAQLQLLQLLPVLFNALVALLLVHAFRFLTQRYSKLYVSDSKARVLIQPWVLAQLLA